MGVRPTYTTSFDFLAGASPATGFLKQSGINIDSKGFIVVNKVNTVKALTVARPYAGSEGRCGDSHIAEEWEQIQS